MNIEEVEVLEIIVVLDKEQDENESVSIMLLQCIIKNACQTLTIKYNIVLSTTNFCAAT